jgi:hypothetical protein
MNLDLYFYFEETLMCLEACSPSLQMSQKQHCWIFALKSDLTEAFVLKALEFCQGTAQLEMVIQFPA